MLSNSVRIMLCQKVCVNMMFFCFFRFVVDMFVVMFCGEIILFIMLFDELVVVISIGLRLSWCVVMICRLLNSVLFDVLLLDRNMVIQLSDVDISGNSVLVDVMLVLSVQLMFEQFSRYVSLMIIIIVMIVIYVCCYVFIMYLMNVLGLVCVSVVVMIVDSRIVVFVLSGWKFQIVVYGLWYSDMYMVLCRFGYLIFMLLIVVMFVCIYMIMIIDMMSYGNQLLKFVCVVLVVVGMLCVSVYCGLGCGFYSCRKLIVMISDVSDDSMLVSWQLRKFDVMNCVSVKLLFDMSSVGYSFVIECSLLYVLIMQNGSSSVKNGNWWLIICVSVVGGSDVIVLSMVIGMLSVLNVIGVVLNSSVQVSVLSVGKLSVIKSVFVIVIGVLNLEIFLSR